MGGFQRLARVHMGLVFGSLLEKDGTLFIPNVPSWWVMVKG